MAIVQASFGRSPLWLRARTSSRRAAVTVMSAFLLVLMLVLVAFAVDVGMLCVAKTELQRSADAAALAGAEELLNQKKLRSGRSAAQFGGIDLSILMQAERAAVREVAATFASANAVGRNSPDVQRNHDNESEGEIVIGQMALTGSGQPALLFDDPAQFNSVIVRVNRTADRNGEVPLFFGKVLGRESAARGAHAQAAFLQSFRGFRVPGGGGDPPPTLMFLPMAIEQSAWKRAQSGIGTDDYGWDDDSERVTRTGDGRVEISLFPLDTGAGGNFGTVDLGSNNSNTPTLKRQIVDGLTHADLDFHGGELALDSRGELRLSGDPGQKLGAIQRPLQAIIGQPRIVPLYRSVTGSGNQAVFTVVEFAGARVMDVKLTGKAPRYVRLQPAAIITRGGIEGQSGSSDIYSPVKLVD